MTKEELFKKYSINESHAEWDEQIDNWYSVEIYRLMHNGKLPEAGDESIGWVLDFMDKRKDMAWWASNVMTKPNWGSYLLTGKRMVYRYSEAITQLSDNPSPH